MPPAPIQLLALIPLAYLMGSIPFGLIVGLARGIDPRKSGSGNIGATNLGRLLGAKYFALVFSLDLLKGALPMLAAGYLLRWQAADRASSLLWMLVGCAAVIGHLCSLFLKFRGGKGVATSAGVALGLFPYFIVPGLIAAAVWIILFLWLRYVSVASIVGSIVFPVAYILLYRRFVLGAGLPLLIFAVLIPVLIVYKHRGNIARLPPRRKIDSRPGRDYHTHIPMPRALKPVIIAIAALLVILIVAILARRLKPREIVPWQHDYPAAIAQGRRENKPVFLYFTASWCGPCQELKTTTWADGDVAALLRGYVPVEIDVDQNPALAREFHVEPIPAFFVIDAASGKIRQATIGAVGPEEFMRWLSGGSS